MVSEKNKKFGKFKLQDPEAEREARKYENPIPSRELILKLLNQKGVPLTRRELADGLRLKEEEQLDAFRRRLRAMERDGQLLRNRNKCYCVIDRADLTSGRVIGNAEGFGFLRPDEGGDDLFLSPRQMRAVLHGDRAVVRVRGVDRRGRKEGALVEVIERNTHETVGRLFSERGVHFVIPDDKKISQDILISDSDLGEAVSGQVVLVTIVEQPTKRNRPIGRVSEVLGDHMAPGMEIEMALRSHELPFEWTGEVEREAKSLDSTVDVGQTGRQDLRKIPFVTIDGEDARDFDDAVYCTRTENGWRLLVAIADVSHYVMPDSSLDQEAVKRGTSVYFPEQVIPMLPEILSNGLCSLVPDEDRFCMVCEMLVSDDGRVYRSRFFDAVMRSQARMTYTEVAGILAGSSEAQKVNHKALVPHVRVLYDLYKALRVQREARGAMDFDTQESVIVFGKQRKIEKIVPLVRNEAHRLIEECMLVANCAAARFLEKKKMSRLLRVHEGPSSEKVSDLRVFLEALGLSLGGGESPAPADYMKLTGQISERADRHVIQTVLLRSLSQAVYTTEAKGHFGLALESYTHFTSPIRRYPDLVTHRAIRHCIQGKKPESFRYSQSDLAMVAEHCSMAERRADDATRNVVRWLKCEYMMDKIGEQFDGVISAVTSFGIFVELSDVYIEGLVHISSLRRDYFHFDPIHHRLNGERSGVSYRLGDRIRVTVASVNLDDRKIDFSLVDTAKKPRRRSRR
ncbi:MAG: ribonuclease R [Methylococcus sp.]|nr:MAG: ribonuclease R [Methylococcus sp.]